MFIHFQLNNNFTKNPIKITLNKMAASPILHMQLHLKEILRWWHKNCQKLREKPLYQMLDKNWILQLHLFKLQVWLWEELLSPHSVKDTITENWLMLKVTMSQLLNISLIILSKMLMRIKIGTSLVIKLKIKLQLFIAIQQPIQ